MNRREFLKNVSIAAIGGTALAGCSRVISMDSVKHPNIIHILIDDLGYSDVGFNGGDFCETPHLDRLAKQGMCFTSAYSAAPLCSPARAAFLTGKSSARLNFENVTKYETEHFDWNREWYEKWADYKLVPPPFTNHLPLEEITVAEALKSAGYTTGITGKWHVSGHHQRYLGWSLKYGPKQQGFDWGVNDFGSHPYSYRERKKEKYEAGQYPEDKLTQSAIEFLSDNRKSENPFFLFVSHFYVHDPVGTECNWLLDKYESKAKVLGRDYKRKRIIYAAMVETMDHYIGQLMKAIDQLGLRENTLVVLTSDNGGNPVHAFNAPLRGGKWKLYEAGVREPTLARWPGVIEPNTICDAPIIGMDFMPTYCQVAGAEIQHQKELDGQSILPVLRGQQWSEFKKRTLYWHFPYYHSRGNYKNRPAKVGIDDGYVSQTPPQSAIRCGDYKLIYFYEDQRCELYNLADDLSEQHDLSVEMPRKTEQLKQKLLNYLKSVDARFPRKREESQPAFEFD